MKHLWSLANFLRIFLALIVVATVLWPQWVIAQPDSKVEITGIDVSRFPEVSVTLYGEDLSTDLANASLTLKEDGKSVNAQSSLIDVGAQTLLVLDASQNVNGAGLVKSSRKDEMVAVVQQLTAQGYLLASKDWLGFMSFDFSSGTPVPAMLGDWNSADHNVVINEVVRYDASPAPVKTPLFDILFAALKQFEDARPPANLQRSVVIFTDGIDIISDLYRPDLINLAKEVNARIHTVQLGSPDVMQGDARKNLENLSLQTGGKYVSLNTESALTPIWQAIQTSQKQRQLTYRSTNASPRELAVESSSASGGQLRDLFAIPLPPIEPPQVRIVRPGLEAITRLLPDGREAEYNTLASEFDPQELDIEIAVDFPGSPVSRQVERVEYIVNDKTEAVTEEPFNRLTFNIAELDHGEYTLRVRATDELGLMGEASQPLTIVIDRLPAPDAGATATAAAIIAQKTTTAIETNAAATAAVLATQQAVAQMTAEAAGQDAAVAQQDAAEAQGEALAAQQEAESARGRAEIAQIGTIIAAVIALAALIFAIWAWRNPRVRQRATEIITGSLQAATEFFGFGGLDDGAQATIKGRLTLIGEAQGEIPYNIDLYGGNTRVGRDPTLVNIVVPDARVSRFHSRISEESDGSFKLWDEGSASGTYVNRDRVELSGRDLHPGDIINFGPVQYRFELMTGESTEPTHGGYDMGNDGTEIWMAEGFDNNADFSGSNDPTLMDTAYDTEYAEPGEYSDQDVTQMDLSTQMDNATPQDYYTDPEATQMDFSDNVNERTEYFEGTQMDSGNNENANHGNVGSGTEPDPR